jgi:CRISPR/Cas system-associated protein Cas7 (RAMP superfamily)
MNMGTLNQDLVYELTINARVTWQAHSMSNAGNNGSNRLMARRQLLAGGIETDACSGNIAKHHHAVLLAEYLAAAGVPLCPACQSLDGRRAAALVGLPDFKKISIERILSACGLCDAHGFLVTAKNAATDGSTEARQRISKHSLVQFSFALALPNSYAESSQLFTRSGDSKDGGQMLMKMPSRSGTYASCVRYKAVGIGVDTEKWKTIVHDPVERKRRHQAILCALRDQFLSPEGALTAKMLPHLSGLVGAVVVKNTVGRAPLYSPLESDFVARLTAMANESCQVLHFETVDAFNAVMNQVIETTGPCLPVVSGTASGKAVAPRGRRK